MNRVVVAASRTTADDDKDGGIPSSQAQSSPAQGVLHLLQGRDECSDVFGPGTRNSVCAPSSTLCCIKPGKDYPSCQQGLGKGWCCVGKRLCLEWLFSGTNDNCYADGPSDCKDVNAVACTNLNPGVAKACCPALTSCTDRQQGPDVRCQIGYPNLMALIGGAQLPSSSSKSVPSSTGTSTSSSSQSASVVSSATPIVTKPDGGGGSESGALAGPEKPSTTLSQGAIAGVTVGAVLFVMLVGLVAWKLWCRNRAGNHDSAPVGNAQYPIAAHPPVTDNREKVQDGMEVVGAAESYHWKQNASGLHVAELVGSYGNHYHGPHEMEGTFRSR
ncbi:hypothetical protein PG995_014979 [Apiospora arundinis]